MLKQIKNFLKETSGNVAMTTALAIFPIITATGAAYDYTNYVSMRGHVQNAIDAAGLAAANQMSDEDNLEELQEYTKKFFKANMPEHIDEDDYELTMKVIPGNTSIEPPIPDQLEVKAAITYDPIFSHLIGGADIAEEIKSVITLGNRTVEIALVLDNSGSMGGNRISTLKTEAKNLIDIVHNSSSLTTIEDPVKFALVPFAGTVNVGTNNKNKNWMDKRGWSPVHHENLDWENTYRTNNQVRARANSGLKFGFQEKINGKWTWKTRHDVFAMLGTEWAGCVEMRPWPHNVLDTYVRTNQGYAKVRDAIDADGDGTKDGTSALFVPYFAPDEPDHNFAEDPSNGTDLSIAPNVDHDPDDDTYRNNYVYDFQDYNPSNPSQRIQLYAEHNNNSSNWMYDKNGSTSQVERTNAIFKYQRNLQYRGGMSTWHGPNDGCTTQAITELTTDREGVKTKIEEMAANGTTNIQQGLTWGWRTLSPGEPFTGGREKDDKRNIKFIVLLTDGNNFYSTDGDSTPNQTAYGAWGYARPDTHSLTNAFNGLPTHNRWAEGLTSNDLQGTIYTNTSFDLTPESSGEFETIMNAHTNQACNNIKNDGISIYAVAFDVPNSGGVRNLLEACSGSGVKDGELVISNGTFYYDVDQGGLADAFGNIARQIANLRISG